MGTTILIRLKDGRAIPLGVDGDAAHAVRLQSDLQEWLGGGSTLTIANAKGDLEDITPRRVLAIEVETSAGDG